MKSLLAVSMGSISIAEAARQLNLPDAGYVFHRLAEIGLPLPQVPKELVDAQLKNARAALDECLIAPPSDVLSRRNSNKRVAVQKLC